MCTQQNHASIGLAFVASPRGWEVAELRQTNQSRAHAVEQGPKDVFKGL